MKKPWLARLYMGIVLARVFIVMLVFLGDCNSYVAAHFFVFHVFHGARGLRFPPKSSSQSYMSGGLSSTYGFSFN